MSQQKTHLVAPGVTLSEKALEIGLGPLRAAHEREQQRLEAEKKEHRRAMRLQRREAK